jgi:glycosyltransferase involved in cell wall biosynthesis
MRALPRLLKKNPSTQVVIVGKEEVSYGRPPREGGTWKQKLLAEVGPELDPARVHFAGTLAYGDLINLFRLSTVHVYLTYPFVLSWSLLEAMATGCAIVGSQTGPVTEVIRDGENGLLTDFFDEYELLEKVSSLLEDRFRRESLSIAARETVVENYDFRRVTLPQYEALIADLGRA